MANQERIWRLRRRPPESFVKKIKKLHPLVATVLYHRGLKSAKEISNFLNPDFEKGSHEAGKLTDLNKAVLRLIKARARHEKVGIFGDYDVDGVAATALMAGLLRALGLKHVYYLPDREKEGYGLNQTGLNYFKDQGAGLVIAVDCGSADIKEVSHAKRLGLDVVILDHHEPPAKLPQALALVNPKRPNQKYPFRDLAATGVVYKFAEGVSKKLGKKVKFPDHWLKWQLDLVALATIADRMPLVGENRILVKFGLIVLQKTKRLGLRALMNLARISPQDLTSFAVGFALAPRLNAAGRMDHANGALALLMADEPALAEDLAKRLDRQNRDRQAKVEQIFKEVKAIIAKYDKTPKVIIAGSPDWPKGLLGLVATKATQLYNAPSFIFQIGEKESVASARSLPGYNVVEGIRRGAKLLKDFGGHTYAAGLTVKNQNFEKLIAHLNRDVKTNAKDAAQDLMVDAAVGTHDLTVQFFKDALKLAPFGDGNPVPLFLLERARLVARRCLGANQDHLECQLELAGMRWRGICFKGAGNFPESRFPQGSLVDIVFEPAVNEWQGQTYYELRIIDLKISKS